MRTEIQVTKERIESLEEELRQIQDALRGAKNKLQGLYECCNHDWAVTSSHIYHQGYTIPGDPPGTMGVDHRGSCYVPAYTEKRWKRTCRKCGKVEFTRNATTRTVEDPKF